MIDAKELRALLNKEMTANYYREQDAKRYQDRELQLALFYEMRALRKVWDWVVTHEQEGR